MAHVMSDEKLVGHLSAVIAELEHRDQSEIVRTLKEYFEDEITNVAPRLLENPEEKCG